MNDVSTNSVIVIEQVNESLVNFRDSLNLGVYRVSFQKTCRDYNRITRKIKMLMLKFIRQEACMKYMEPGGTVRHCSGQQQCKQLLKYFVRDTEAC